MIRPTSPRERRLVALLILTAAVAAIYYLIIAPISAGFSARSERFERLTLTHTHNLRTIATIPRLRREAEARRAATATFVVRTTSVESARELLKDRLQRAIDSAGGEFREGNDAEGSAGWARARASARMTLPQLTAALTRLQNQPPWLIVESLTVTASDALVTGQPSIMDVEIEASIPIRAAAAR